MKNHFLLIPDPVASECTRWQHDPYSFGAYSYIAKGTDPKSTLGVIAEPFGRIGFAGEHAIPEFNATAHGALWSGLREAQRIEPTAQIPGVKTDLKEALDKN